MTLDNRSRRTAAVAVALLGASAAGIGALTAASPALAASPKAASPAPAVSPKASAGPAESVPDKSPAPAKSSAPAFAVTKLTSAFGATAGGTKLILTGKGFSRLDTANKSSVLFGKTPAAMFLVLSDTQIAATAPAGTGTKVQVSVTDGKTASPDVTADDFTYVDPITVVVPDKTDLSAAGGTKVRLTLSGKGLDLGTSQSTFAQQKVTATIDGANGSLTWIDATHVDVTAPAGTPTKTGGKVSVVVSRNGVPGPADATHARYVAVVTKLSVNSGRTTGTTGVAGKPALTITGVGLTGATGFLFGQTKGECAAVSGKESTTWTCAKIPAGTGAVGVLPTFGDGRVAGLTPGAIFAYTNL